MENQALEDYLALMGEGSSPSFPYPVPHSVGVGSGSGPLAIKCNLAKFCNAQSSCPKLFFKLGPIGGSTIQNQQRRSQTDHGIWGGADVGWVLAFSSVHGSCVLVARGICAGKTSDTTVPMFVGNSLLLACNPVGFSTPKAIPARSVMGWNMHLLVHADITAVLSPIPQAS